MQLKGQCPYLQQREPGLLFTNVRNRCCLRFGTLNLASQCWCNRAVWSFVVSIKVTKIAEVVPECCFCPTHIHLQLLFILSLDQRRCCSDKKKETDCRNWLPLDNFAPAYWDAHRFWTWKSSFPSHPWPSLSSGQGTFWLPSPKRVTSGNRLRQASNERRT